jgi:hypothetical protein
LTLDQGQQSSEWTGDWSGFGQTSDDENDGNFL